MDWLTTIPLIVGVIGNLSACAMEALAERLLTIVAATFIIGSVSVVALTAFARVWIKGAIDEMHRRARHDSEVLARSVRCHLTVQDTVG